MRDRSKDLCILEAHIMFHVITVFDNGIFHNSFMMVINNVFFKFILMERHVSSMYFFPHEKGIAYTPFSSFRSMGSLAESRMFLRDFGGEKATFMFLLLRILAILSIVPWM